MKPQYLSKCDAKRSEILKQKTLTKLFWDNVEMKMIFSNNKKYICDSLRLQQALWMYANNTRCVYRRNLLWCIWQSTMCYRALIAHKCTKTLKLSIETTGYLPQNTHTTFTIYTVYCIAYTIYTFMQYFSCREKSLRIK